MIRKPAPSVTALLSRAVQGAVRRGMNKAETRAFVRESLALSRLPSELAALTDARKEEIEDLRHARASCYAADPLLLGNTKLHRIAQATQIRARALHEAAEMAGFRRTECRWVGGHHNTVATVVDTAGEAGGLGATEKVWHAKKTRSGTNSTWSFLIQRNWRREIRDAGIAVVDAGVVVWAVPLAVAGTLPGVVVSADLAAPSSAVEGWSVIRVRQGRGFSFVQEAGYVFKFGDVTAFHTDDLKALRALHARVASEDPAAIGAAADSLIAVGKAAGERALKRLASGQPEQAAAEILRYPDVAEKFGVAR